MRKAGTADRPVLERLWLMFRHDMLLTARLSGHQIMINGHALFPPLSVVATIPADPEPRSGWSARSEATNDLDGRRSLILPAGSHQELPGDGHHSHGM